MNKQWEDGEFERVEIIAHGDYRWIGIGEVKSGLKDSIGYVRPKESRIEVVARNQQPRLIVRFEK